MSVREIAREVGVSVGAMRYHEPNLVREIARRYVEHCRSIRLEKNAMAKRAVLDHVRDWQAVDTFPIAKKRLLKLLMTTTGLPKEVLRRAIKDVLRDQVA